MLILAFAALLALVACAIGFQQVRTFREASADGGDLFAYSKRRLIIRLVGLGVLLAVAVTLAIFELGAPLSPAAAGWIVTALLIEVGTLFVIAILDLRETARRG